MRAELATQIAVAQSDVEKQIAELNLAAMRGGDSAALVQAHAQLQGLTRLQQRIARSDAQSLSSMRSEVAAVVAVAQLLAQQSRPDSPLSSPAVVQLYLASAQARGAVNSFVQDYYGNRMFDRYLTFASAEDEEAYRRREAERQQEIQKAMAEHTPQGDLRALDVSIAQLQDAGKHGADKSPEFQSRLQALEAKRKSLGAALDAQQPAVQSADPLDAVQAASQPVAPEVIASLRAAGVVMPSQDGEGPGVNASAGKSPRGRS